MDKSLLLYYRNLPKQWAKYDKSSFRISDVKFQTLVKKLKTAPEGAVVYMKNACKLFVPILIDEFKVFGIDFVDYFDSAFSQERDFDIPFENQIFVVYNVGLEKALNTEFSAKLLLGLIEKLKSQEKIVFVCSHLGYTDFYRKYEIDIVNKIQLQEKTDEPFL